MYRASDAVDHEASLAEITAAAETLDLDDEAIMTARELFLSVAPNDDRSEETLIGASLYAASLLVGAERSQGAVADAVGISRLSVQANWKSVVDTAGFEPPSW